MAYFAGGHGTGYLLNEFWEYNINTDTWTQKPNFPFAPRSFGISFSLCEKGYLGTGNDGSGITYLSDFWEYDLLTGNWTQKTNFPLPGCMASAWFIIHNRAFVGTGVNHTTIFNNFFEYIPDGICATAVEELSGVQLSISPNPAHDVLTVNYQVKGSKNVKAAITDIQGKVIQEFTLPAASNNATFSLRNFDRGVYLIKVNNVVKRFVIN